MNNGIHSTIFLSSRQNINIHTNIGKVIMILIAVFEKGFSGKITLSPICVLSRIKCSLSLPKKRQRQKTKNNPPPNEEEK